MKKLILQFAFSLLVFLGAPLVASHAVAGDLGLGIVLGAPTAISLKLWLSRERAIDGGIAFSSNNYFLIFGDYLVHYPRPFKTKEPFFSDVDFYVGAGANLAVTTNDRSNNDNYLGKKSGSVGLGIRVPFGLAWKPANPPIDVFAELVPGISVIPATTFVVQGGLGIRYYF